MRPPNAVHPMPPIAARLRPTVQQVQRLGILVYFTFQLEITVPLDTHSACYSRKKAEDLKKNCFASTSTSDGDRGTTQRYDLKFYFVLSVLGRLTSNDILVRCTPVFVSNRGARWLYLMEVMIYYFF